MPFAWRVLGQERKRIGLERAAHISLTFQSGRSQSISIGRRPRVHPETKGRRCPIAGETARKRQDVDKALAIALRCAPNFESVSYNGSVLTEPRADLRICENWALNPIPFAWPVRLQSVPR